MEAGNASCAVTVCRKVNAGGMRMDMKQMMQQAQQFQQRLTEMQGELWRVDRSALRWVAAW